MLLGSPAEAPHLPEYQISRFIWLPLRRLQKSLSISAVGSSSAANVGGAMVREMEKKIRSENSPKRSRRSMV